MSRSRMLRFLFIGLSVLMPTMTCALSADAASAVSNYDRNSIYLKSGCAGSFFVLGGKPFRLMNMYNDLSPVMKDCPSAMEQLKLQKKEMNAYWTWYGLAWFPILAGVVVASGEHDNPNMAWLGIGLELSAFIPLGISVYHGNKAQNYG